MASEKPNILLIMSDEHDAAVMGCYGDPLVRTPNLDGLARRGVTFDACYCNSPLCVPSRLSFTACQYISRCGAWSNTSMLPGDEYPSIARTLQAAGYETFLCGKQHYDKTRRYGFTDLYPDHPANNGLKHGRSERRPVELLDKPDKDSWDTRASWFKVSDDGGHMPKDRKVTDLTCDFLEKRSADDKPFFLFTGYTVPHFPLTAPQAFYDHYRGKVPEPAIPEGFLDTLPRNYQQLRSGFGVPFATDEQIKLGREFYWALTEWFDQQVGRVLSTLAKQDYAGNTVVIYTSDHGENKGDHGLWWKNCMYDHSARVPLIVSWPARWAGGQRRSQVCSLVDLVATITEIAGGKPHPQWDGDSLINLLDKPDVPWKNFALSEYYGHNITSGFTMLRQGRYKYVYHNRVDQHVGDEHELYDMHNDPGEFHNLADDPAHADRIAQMHAAMLEELGEDPNDIEQRALKDESEWYPGRGPVESGPGDV